MDDIKNKLEEIEKNVQAVFAEAPFYVKQNSYAIQLQGIIGDLFLVMSDMADRIEALQHDQFSRGDF